MSRAPVTLQTILQSVSLATVSLIVIISAPALAQPIPSDLPPLYPADSCWFGFERGDAADRLTSYDLAFSKTNESLWRDLHPRDFVDIKKGSADTIGVLLANPASTSALYFVSVSAELQPEPIWQSNDNTYDRIVAVVADGDFGPTFVLRGDSALVGVKTDGSEAYRLTLRVSDYIIVGEDEASLIGVEQTGDRLFFVQIGLKAGALQTRTLLEGSGPVRLGRMTKAKGKDLTAIAVADPPTLFTVRSGSRGFVSRRDLDRLPDAIVPVEGSADFALISNRLPAPEITIVNDRRERRSLVYPSDEPFLSVVRVDDAIVLVGATKSVVYNASMEYVGTASATGGPNARVLPRPGRPDERLLISANGTDDFVVERDPLAWYKRNQLTIIGISVGALLLVGAFLILRRVRYTRTVNANLLQGSEGEGILLLSNRGRVIRMNPRARRYIGLEGREYVNAHVGTYLSAPPLSHAADDVRKLVSTGLPFETEVARSGNDGDMMMLIAGRPMTGRYGGANGFIVTMRDITSSIERERLVNWASVAHHIAHEMKTPLSTVRTSAELLRNDLVRLTDPGTSLHQAGRIIRQSARLREIVEDLLTVARSQDLTFVDLDASLLLSSAIDDFAEYVDSNLTIGFRKEGDNFRARADADKLSIAVRNVVDNARQAIGNRKGRIDVTLTDVGDMLEIRIADTGKGMSEETRERLFQPYYTEKEGGSGIGTMIIKRVIEGHGGSVKVESEIGEGTTFTLTIRRDPDGASTTE